MYVCIRYTHSKLVLNKSIKIVAGKIGHISYLAHQTEERKGHRDSIKRTQHPGIKPSLTCPDHPAYVQRHRQTENSPQGFQCGSPAVDSTFRYRLHTPLDPALCGPTPHTSEALLSSDPATCSSSSSSSRSLSLAFIF